MQPAKRAVVVTRWAVALTVVGGLVGGCGGGDPSPTTSAGPEASTTAPAVTAPAGPEPTTPADPGPGPGPILGTGTSCSTPGTDSRADFDPAEGQYAAILHGVNVTTRTIAFDVVQLPASDPDADPDVPRELASIVNSLDRTDEAIVRTDARIRVPVSNDQGYQLVAGELEQLRRQTVVFVGLRAGVVTDVCQVVTNPPDVSYKQGATPTADSDASCPRGTSQADFDPQAGSYAVWLYSVNVTRRSVAFDVVQFLSGDDAVRAYRRDHPEDPNGFPANDYDVLNAVDRTDEAVVAADARIWLLAAGETGAPVVPFRADLAEVRTYPGAGRHPGYGLYRLTLGDGRVTDLCQVFTP